MQKLENFSCLFPLEKIKIVASFAWSIIEKIALRSPIILCYGLPLNFKSKQVCKLEAEVFATRLGRLRSRPSPGAGRAIVLRVNGTRDKSLLSLLATMAAVLSARILVATLR